MSAGPAGRDGTGLCFGPLGSGGRTARVEGIPQAQFRVPGTILKFHWESSLKQADPCSFPGHGA